MSNVTIFEFIFDIFLIAGGAWVLLNEKKIARYERLFFKKIKKAVKKWL